MKTNPTIQSRSVKDNSIQLPQQQLMPQQQLIHYTLNTADTYDCSAKKFDPQAIKKLKPIATRAISEGSTRSDLPAPFEDYNVKATVVEEFALFDIYKGKKELLVTNAVAWSNDGQAEVWPLFENLYLKLSGQFEMPLLSRAPIIPSQLPWLTTLVLPNPSAMTAIWLADFEQCMALALIDATKPEREKPRGFGS